MINQDPDDFVLDVYAVKALFKGEATPDQQMRAWHWLVYDSCGYNKSTHLSTDRDSSFASGKREVALEFMKMVNFDVAAFKASLRTPQKEFVASKKPRRSTT